MDIGLESMDELYVDECQDLPPGVLHMLLGLLKKPDGFVMFCGDSAQTISKGSSFRFDDLSALYYRHMSEIRSDCANQALVKQKLTRNYRSHNGILRLASSVIDLIEAYFEDSIDKMERDYSEEEGALPSVVTGDAQRGWTMLFQTGKSNMEFGAHHAIIVRNEKRKNQVQNMKNRPGFSGTVFDAKGLEFSEVILYNFFTDSPAKNEWRIILEQLSNKNVPVFGGIPAMNPAKHNILVLELKELYTAITRPMHKLWIVDEMVQSMEDRELHPMFQYWMNGGCGPGRDSLLAFVDQEEVLELFSSHSNHSTPEEWAKTGHYLFQNGHYENALHCFQQAGDGYIDKQRFVQACLTRSKAEKLSKKAGEAHKARTLFRDAGELFENIDELVSAAHCYSQAAQHTKAGELYHASARRSDDEASARKLYGSAAAAYLEGKQYLIASSVLEEAKMYEDALRVLKNAYLFADAVAFAGKHRGEINPHNLRVLAEQGLLHNHRRHEEEGMWNALGLLPNDLARESLVKKHRNHLGHRLLVQLYKDWTPPRLVDAGDVLDGQGEWREALDLYVLSGDPSCSVKAGRSCVKLVSLHARAQAGMRLAVHFSEGMKVSEASRLLDDVLGLRGLPAEERHKCLVLSHVVKGNVDGLKSCHEFFLKQEMSQNQRTTPERVAEACAWELRCLAPLLLSSPTDSMKPHEWASLFLRHVRLCTFMFPVEGQYRELDQRIVAACEKYFSCTFSADGKGAVSVRNDLWGEGLVKDAELRSLFKAKLRLEEQDVIQLRSDQYPVQNVARDVALRRMRRSLMECAHSFVRNDRTDSIGRKVTDMVPCFSLAFYGSCERGAKCKWSHKGSHADELAAYVSVVGDMACGFDRLLNFGLLARQQLEDKPSSEMVHNVLKKRRFWLEILVEVFQSADIRLKRLAPLDQDVLSLPADLRIALFNLGSTVWLAKWNSSFEPRFDTGTLLHTMVLKLKLMQPTLTVQAICQLVKKIPNLRMQDQVRRLASQELLRVQLAWSCLYMVHAIESGYSYVVLFNSLNFAKQAVENIEALHINPMDLIELLEWGVTVSLGCSRACHGIVAPRSYLSVLVGRRDLVTDMMTGYKAHMLAPEALQGLTDVGFQLLSGLVQGRVFESMTTHNKASHVKNFKEPSFDEYRSMCTRLALLMFFASFNMDSSDEAMKVLHLRISSFADAKRGPQGLKDWPSKRDRETWLGQDHRSMLEGIRRFLSEGTNPMVRWTRGGNFEAHKDDVANGGYPVAFFPLGSIQDAGVVLFGENATRGLARAAAQARSAGGKDGEGKSEATKEADFDQILQRDRDAANRILGFFRGIKERFAARQRKFNALSKNDQAVEKLKEQAEARFSDWICGQETIADKCKVWKYAAAYRGMEVSKTCVGLTIVIIKLDKVMRSLEGSHDEQSLERLDVLAELHEGAQILRDDLSIGSECHWQDGFDWKKLTRLQKEAEVTVLDCNNSLRAGAAA